MNKTVNPSARLVRWRLDLDDYTYDIQYKPGKTNNNADALSRIRLPVEVPEHSKLVSVITRAQARTNLLANSATNSSNVPVQQNDNSSSNQIIDSSVTATTKSVDSSISNSIPTSNNYPVQSAITNRTTLVDEKDIARVINEFHDNPIGGHQGVMRTYKRLQSYYYFTKMLSRIKKYINKCDLCQRNKVRKLTKCPMKITSTSKSPFDK